MKYNIEIDKDLEKYLIKTLETFANENLSWAFNVYPDGQQEIEWFYIDGIEPPNYEDIFAKANKLKENTETEYYKTEYQRLRKEAYPPIEDYLDAVVKGNTAEIEKYINTCLDVKARFPKG